MLKLENWIEIANPRPKRQWLCRNIRQSRRRSRWLGAELSRMLTFEIVFADLRGGAISALAVWANQRPKRQWLCQTSASKGVAPAELSSMSHSKPASQTRAAGPCRLSRASRRSQPTNPRRIPRPTRSWLFWDIRDSDREFWFTNPQVSSCCTANYVAMKFMKFAPCERPLLRAFVQSSALRFWCIVWDATWWLGRCLRSSAWSAKNLILKTESLHTQQC